MNTRTSFSKVMVALLVPLLNTIFMCQQRHKTHHQANAKDHRTKNPLLYPRQNCTEPKVQDKLCAITKKRLLRCSTTRNRLWFLAAGTDNCRLPTYNTLSTHNKFHRKTLPFSFNHPPVQFQCFNGAANTIYKLCTPSTER